MNGSPAGVFVWDAEFPLVTNPLVVGAWARAMGATWLTSLVVLTGIAAAADGLDRLPWMAGIFTLVVGGVFLLGLAILWLVFGNRYRARFQVSERGVAYQALDRRGRVLARFAVVAGLLAASPGAAGAGLVSISRERIQIPWSAVTEA
ncbi:MAG TPA: hypothetical protein ENI96_01915, partial [Sedimenticola thiotaurini]|nr:hypothetical protein [Sedimenticola thiotaurini]